PTVLSGALIARTVVQLNNASAQTILDGLEIADGAGQPAFSDGGGLRITGGAPTIRNCTIRNNTARNGGGAYVTDASPTFENCVFQQNSVTTGNGGAIAISAATATTVTLTDCTFTANSARHTSVGDGQGGAVYNSGVGALVVTGCTFTSNTCTWSVPRSAQMGGAIHNAAPGLVIDRCVFTSNSAQIGGAIYSSADMTLTNSLLAGNLVFDPYDNGPVVNAGQGGAVYSDIGANATMLNCTAVANWSQKKAAVSLDAGLLANSVLWGNEIAPLGPGEDPLGLSRQQFLGGASVRYCDIAGLFDGVPGEDPPDPANFPGSTQADPLFVLPPIMSSSGFYTPGDAHVQGGSPTIDAGENASAPSGLTDLDGSPRLFDDPNTPDTGSGAAPLVDMGAYEFGAAAPCPGDVDGDGDVDLTDLAILLANFDATGATREMGDLDGDGVVNLTDLAILLSVFETPCD
ncbi:MAG: right-handed parallel beta-helix repeat-containing protein, partial [Planctomycetota bacterium]